MKYETILYAVEKDVALITLNLPDRLNATEELLIQELMHVTNVVAKDDDVGAVVITGNGRAFSAGGDLKTLEKGFDVVEGRHYLSRSIPWIMQLTQMEKPVIAAVNGLAVGSGFSIAMMCDFIFASDKAKFGMPYINIGLVPDIGAMYFLPRLVGLPRAKELYASGRMLTSNEAFEWGIANRVVGSDHLLDEALAFAGQLARGPRFSIAMTKKILNASHALTLGELLEYEAFAQSICFQTNEHKTAVKRFLEQARTKLENK
jgi:2-(1,2-epoxy-1,2-dihydrophenyl)acetyl-CoA isomerase